MKSTFKSLLANDYVHAAYKAAIGAIIGWVLPILSGHEVFSALGAKTAILGAISLGLS